MYRKSFLGSLRPFDVAQGRLCGGHSELLAASPRRVVCGEYTRSGKDTLHNMVARANSVFFLPPICLGLRGPTRTANVYFRSGSITSLTSPEQSPVMGQMPRDVVRLSAI